MATCTSEDQLQHSLLVVSALLLAEVHRLRDVLQQDGAVQADALQQACGCPAIARVFTEMLAKLGWAAASPDGLQLQLAVDCPLLQQAGERGWEGALLFCLLGPGGDQDVDAFATQVAGIMRAYAASAADTTLDEDIAACLAVPLLAALSDQPWMQPVAASASATIEPINPPTIPDSMLSPAVSGALLALGLTEPQLQPLGSDQSSSGALPLTDAGAWLRDNLPAARLAQAISAALLGVSLPPGSEAREMGAAMALEKMQWVIAQQAT